MPADTEIRILRTGSGMTQRAFSDYFEIPKRTIEEWEANRREPPAYLVALMRYKLQHEGLLPNDPE